MAWGGDAGTWGRGESITRPHFLPPSLILILILIPTFLPSLTFFSLHSTHNSLLTSLFSDRHYQNTMADMMPAIPTDSPEAPVTVKLMFALSRAPRFDVAGPIVWEAWHGGDKKGRTTVSVTWLPEDADLLRYMESSAPWDQLFTAHPDLEGLYRSEFWGIDALYPEIVNKMERLNERLAYR